MDLVTENQRLRAALLEACDQLEGWISWKCPRKHVPEHMATLQRLRAPAALSEQGAVALLLAVVPTSLRMPDADTDVLIFDAAGDQAQLGAYVGSDDDPFRDPAAWVNAQGELVPGVHHWAELPRLKP